MALRYAINPDYLKADAHSAASGALLYRRRQRTLRACDGRGRRPSRKRYFPGQNPIGKHVYFPPESTDGERTDEIVGVVGHVKQFGLAPDKSNNVEAEFYEPFPSFWTG